MKLYFQVHTSGHWTVFRTR